MPPLPKGRRQRANRPQPKVSVATGKPKAPAARKEWLPETKTRWKTFWASDAARVLAPAVDTGALERLFDLYDERERAMSDFRKARFVKGSQGQDVLNPLGRLVGSFDSEIRQLEDRLGFTPASRLRLGIDLTPPKPPPARTGKSSRDRPDPRTAKKAGQ